MMDWGNGGPSAGDWVAMSAMMVLFWGVLIALAVWVVRTARSDRGSRSADRGDTLLAERFARGEIDSEEFTRSRELLHSTRSAAGQRKS
jgi:putative membrane protein